MSRIPMISSRVLTNMPELFLAEIGAKGLARAFKESDLSEELLGATHHFILQSSLSSFVESAARQLGEERLGLLLAPMLSIRDYGIFGDYILSGDTLFDALRRSTETIQYHGSHDRLFLAVNNGTVVYRYQFAHSQLAGYENLAYCAVGIMKSIVQQYLGSQWCPEYVELDFPKPSQSDFIEEALCAKVIYDGKGVSLIFDAYYLTKTRPQTNSRNLTCVSDIHIRRRGIGPTRTKGIVRELIGAQILGANVSIEKTAEMLDLGIRSLQRSLDAEGTNFRSLTNAVMAERAISLLRESDYSITMISEDLGYSDPAHFSRAFKKVVGVSPLKLKNSPRFRVG